LTEHEMELLGALKEKKDCNLHFNHGEQVLFFELSRKLNHRIDEMFEIHKRVLMCSKMFIEHPSIEVMPDSREVWVVVHNLGQPSIVSYSYEMMIEQNEKKLEKQLRKIKL